MVVRIRLASHPLAAKKKPLYNIVVIHNRKARQKQPIETVGLYNPIPKALTESDGTMAMFKDVTFDSARIKYWLGVGAQPSEPVRKLMERCGLLPPKPSTLHLKKKLGKKKAAKSAKESGEKVD